MSVLDAYYQLLHVSLPGWYVRDLLITAPFAYESVVDTINPQNRSDSPSKYMLRVTKNSLHKRSLFDCRHVVDVSPAMGPALWYSTPSCSTPPPSTTAWVLHLRARMTFMAELLLAAHPDIHQGHRSFWEPVPVGAVHPSAARYTCARQPLLDEYPARLI